MCAKRQVLEKNVYIWAQYGFATKSPRQKECGVETYWLSGKVKLRSTAFSKESDLTMCKQITNIKLNCLCCIINL